ncbi:MAG: 2Fe-2S iron-sulfur cluster binding domain-containing protein [Acidobacteriia bacterium]|nr:2Fe-2S iron-sulfur cluster binding domain-containing protein [Terriglobia bacterium]
MPAVQYGSCSYELKQGESVLDALLRNGVAVAHACKAGSCGSCLLRAVEGELPARAQAGLKDAWRARGYFLACVCQPEGDLTVAAVGNDARIAATITALDRLTHDVLRVRLVCDAPFDFRPGQYVTLFRDNALARSYSIASLPEEGVIELHVRRIPNGSMSGWLYQEACAGTPVHLQGPSGECFYAPGREDQPLLLIGTGTGLAPLYGIVRDALKSGHRGPIHLFHGAVRPAGLYLGEELAAMAAANANLTYTPSVLEADVPGPFEVGPIDGIIARRFPKLDGWRGFVCGDPALVQMLKKKLFLSGIAVRDINADAFLPSAS